MVYSDSEIQIYQSCFGYLIQHQLAIDEIQFRMAGGNIDAGTFKLYGIKDS